MKYGLSLLSIIISALIMGFIVPALWHQGSSHAFDMMMTFIVISIIGTTVGLIFLIDAVKKDLLQLKRAVFGEKNVNG